MSKVHLTSAEVNGLPSCHLTPCFNLNVSFLPPSPQAQLSARSGTSVSVLFCALLWSNITRLLKTGMKGTLIEKVAPSWIEALPGLSR